MAKKEKSTFPLSFIRGKCLTPNFVEVMHGKIGVQSSGGW